MIDMSEKWISILLFVTTAACGTKQLPEMANQYGDNQLYKLAYNNSDLLVDLDAGFKAVPMPMDFDGDGDLDFVFTNGQIHLAKNLFAETNGMTEGGGLNSEHTTLKR